MKRLKIKIKNFEFLVEITNKNPKTAEAIWNFLPIESEANIWGKEIYFETPVEIKEENSQQEVEVGDIAYWPPGKALCIFFGRTPISTNNRPKAYSPVNVFGKIISDMKDLKNVKDGDRIRVEKCKRQ